MSYQNDLKQVFSYITSLTVLEGSSLDIANTIANKGENTTRKECLDILDKYGINNLKSFKENSLKLTLFYIKIALKDNSISIEEINSVKFLKLLLDINEGDFLVEINQYNEVADIIKAQIESMYADDNKIDSGEAVQKVHLQEIFGLNYDQFLQITNDIELNAIDRGAEYIDLDSFISKEAYNNWSGQLKEEVIYKDDQRID